MALADAPSDRSRDGLRYEDAGVSIARGDALVDALRPHAAATARPGTMEGRGGGLGGLGGFGALFDLAAVGMRDPVLVSGTDGVGTKLMIAIEAGHDAPHLHDGIGQDCVAMCVNDVVCQGATPLFMLDYFATGRLDVAVAERVIAGLARAAAAADCALIGGETAEMPGLLAAGHYDLAGFCVGAVERGAILPRVGEVRAGDRVVGVASTGVHSNGFSLVRRVVADRGLGWHDPAPWGGGTLAEALLVPTALYVRPALAAIGAGGVRALAHVTGGGLPGNLARVLPGGLGAALDAARWRRPPVFDWLIGAGVPEDEAWRAFNMGLGMTLVVAPDAAEGTIAAFAAAGQEAGVVGTIVDGTGVRIA